MLLKLGYFIRDHYKMVLIGYLVFTAICLFLATRLKMSTQMMDMLPSDEPSVVAYDRAIKNFEGIDLTSIVVQGNEKDIFNYLEDIKPDIEKLKDVSQVITGSERDFIRQNGLLLTKLKDLKNMKTFFTASSIRDFIKGMNESYEKEYISGEDSGNLSRDKQQMLQQFNTLEDFAKAIKNNEKDPAKLRELADAFIVGKKYMLSPDRTLGLMFVKSPLNLTDLENVVPFIEELEKLVKDKQEKHNVKAGLSGILVLQRDEMVATTSDMQVSSLVSLVLIILIFYLGFRLLRYSLLAVLPLITGIITALGLTYLITGQLNLFTAMMGVILVGLGIDYAIHIIALYTEERDKGTPVREAIDHVFKKTSKGVVTGSITTATAFLMFSISSFPGFREFGIVLGVGIICTMAASIFMLPPLFMIFGKKDLKVHKTKSQILLRAKKLVINKSWYAVGLVLILMAVSVAGVPRLEFSENLKDIEPKGLESLELSDLMIEKFDISQDLTLAVSDTLEEAYALKDKVKDMHTVGAVESITDYMPPVEKQNSRLNYIKGIKASIPRVVDKGLHINSLKEELIRLKNNLIEISDLAFMGGEKKIVSKIDSLLKQTLFTDIANNIKQHKPHLGTFQKYFMGQFMETIRASNDSKILTMEDLPKNVRSNYVGKDGTYLTLIYPEGDVWSENFQKIYNNEIANLKDYTLTGTFIMNHKVMNIAGAEGKKVLLFVVLACFIVLLIDFRSFKYAALAMVPMVGTMTLLIGIMSWLGIKFDYVNIMALPIIIGIGVDDGVHIIHRYLIEKNILPAMISTGRGILLSSLTTSAAFGTMMLGTYQGFVSFGLVLVIGIMLAYLLTVLILTSLVVILDKHKMKEV